VPQNINAFSQKNELMRIESFDRLDSKLEAPLMAFFRRIGLPHIYWEFFVPALKEENTLVITAVKDRAWPPWGIGAHTIHALSLACPVSPESAGVSNVFVLEEDVGNVGLIAAVYKEMLAALSRRGVKEISYIVLEGSVFASRVLTNIGFKPTDELFLTHESRYKIFSAEPQAHLRAMGLDQIVVPDLLEGKLDDRAFSMVAQWIGATSVGSLPFWSERGGVPEVIPNTGGFLHASQPGGVPIRRRPE
jgi:hypothetical protein